MSPLAPVRAENTVDFPDPGAPIIPSFILLTLLFYIQQQRIFIFQCRINPIFLVRRKQLDKNLN
jgi:hypothetical protein